MKNGTIVWLSLAAACVPENDLIGTLDPAGPPAGESPEDLVEVVPTVDAAPPVDVTCGVVELLVVGVTPSPGFQTDGVAEITLVPLDTAGKPVLDCDWTVAATVDGVTNAGVTSVVTMPADLATVYALDLDSSGSMVSQDPLHLRIPAAQTFIAVTDAANPVNEYGVFTFPREDIAPFVVTEMLADFTNDATQAIAAVGTVGDPAGLTPLYESAIEVIEYQAAVTSADLNKALVLFTDGVPTDYGVTLDDVLTAALASGTTIHTVGLGLASQADAGADPDAVGVLQELAFETGGSYSAASEATDLEATFANLAVSITTGHLVVTIVFVAPPASGTDVSGLVTVDELSATWSFIAP